MIENQNGRKQEEIRKEKTGAYKGRKHQNNSPKVEENIDLIRDLYSYSLFLKRCFPMIEKHFSENLDIIELHEFLMKKFEFEKQNKPKVLSYLIGLERDKLSKPVFKIELRNILSKIHMFTTELNCLQNDVDKIEYLSKAEKFLTYFQSMGHKKKIISFGAVKQNKKDDTVISTQRKFIIDKYVDIYQKYHDLNIIYQVNTKTLCQVCKFDLSSYNSEDIGGVVCPRCNAEKTALIHTNIATDVKFNNSKDGYEDRENFWKALQRFQGKQNNHIPDRLYKELDEYFKSFGLPAGDQICKMEITKKGTRGNTSRSMMFKALSETNNSVFYEDVNLICHLYWGWLLPDISSDEEQIMKDYDNTQEIFKKIPKDRRSSLNAQYRLWQHLRIRGYKYPIDDFKIVKTPDILVEHDRIMKIMCEECNLVFIPAL